MVQAAGTVLNVAKSLETIELRIEGISHNLIETFIVKQTNKKTTCNYMQSSITCTGLWSAWECELGTIFRLDKQLGNVIF